MIFLLFEDDDSDDERSWLAWCCNLAMSSSDRAKFSPPVSSAIGLLGGKEFSLGSVSLGSVSSSGASTPSGPSETSILPSSKSSDSSVSFLKSIFLST